MGHAARQPPRRAADPADRDFDAAMRLQGRGELAQARRRHEKILAARPSHLGSLNNLAAIELEHGDPARALALLVRAVKADPTNPLSMRNTATALARLGRDGEAAGAFQLALRLAPDDAAAHHGLAIAWRALERWAEAERAARAACDLAPGFAAAHDNLAVILAAQGRAGEAIASHRRATALAPASASAWSNLANSLLIESRPAEAAAAWRRSLAIDPDHADAHLHLGMALLKLGQLREGWREYEWRWRGGLMQGVARPFAMPRWDGGDEPRALLLHAEQGFGDTLQFCRYAPLAAARGHRIVLEVQRELVGLLRDSFAGAAITVVATAQDYPGIAGLPAADAHCPLISLPLAFATSLATIPAASYLRADPGKTLAWRRNLDGALGDKPRVGLVWAGNPRTGQALAIRDIDGRRSLPLAMLAPLATADVALVSLQKGTAAAQLGLAGAPALYDPSEALGDFSDTAALVAALDLVISVDTAVAHLAGAMGKPVWMLSRHDACWRWLEDRADSPWYPSMRIFRQGADRSWGPVIAAVGAALARWSAAASPGSAPRG